MCHGGKTIIFELNEMSKTDSKINKYMILYLQFTELLFLHFSLNLKQDIQSTFTIILLLYSSQMINFILKDIKLFFKLPHRNYL